MTSAPSEPTFSAPIPILRMFHLEKTLEFYVDFLGFVVDWQTRFSPDGPVYMQVSLGACRLQLSEHFGDGTPGAKVKIETAGLDTYQQRLLAKGYRHSKPGILDQTWHEREMGISDPSGNAVIFFERVPKR